MLLIIQAEGEPLVQPNKPHYALHGCKPVNAPIIRIYNDIYKNDMIVIKTNASQA